MAFVVNAMSVEDDEAYAVDHSGLSDGGKTIDQSFWNVSEERQEYLRGFVRLVQKNPQLYCKNLKGYSKSTDKVLTWASLGQELNPQMDGDVAHDLFKKIRERFGKERRKMKMSMPRSGAGSVDATQVYHSTWFLYNDLLFLADVIQPRSTSSNTSFKVPATTVRPPTPVVVEPTTPKQARIPQAMATPNSAGSSWLDVPAPGSSRSSRSPSLCSSMDADDGVPSPQHSPQPAGTSSSSSSGAAILQNITPARTVPPNDPVKRRRRPSDQGSSAMESFISTAASALDKIGKQPSELNSYTEGFGVAIITALQKVPEQQLIDCTMEVLKVIKRFSASSWRNQSESEWDGDSTY